MAEFMTCSRVCVAVGRAGVDHKSQGRDGVARGLARALLSSNSFDLVLSAEVFEHIPEPYMALAEVPGAKAWRLLRLDGECRPPIKGHADLDVERSWQAV